MNALRVTAGTLRGRRIAMPKGEVRPTSERARQAFFDIVGNKIVDALFLDLFAGSGIFSFEAVSRGARQAVAVDASHANTRAIGSTARELNAPVQTITADVLAGIKRLGNEVFDVIYADPPYEWPHYDQLLTAIDSSTALAGDAVVAIEHRRRTEPFTITPSRLRPQRRAEYGEIWISFFIS
jgi:16S rRNA (guanine966-N2)-methyltransferase